VTARDHVADYGRGSSGAPDGGARQAGFNAPMAPASSSRVASARRSTRGHHAIELAAERRDERMSDWVDTFASALGRDLLDAADFAR
jgi:hypothetical protein